MKKIFTILAASMLFSVTAFSQVPAEKIISMTPGLPSVTQLLDCYKAAEDPSHETVLEKDYVSDFLEAWDDARSKISDMREASKGTGIPSDIINAQTQGVSVKQAAGMTEADARKLAQSTMMGRLGSMGLDAGDLAKMQSGNLSEAEQQEMANKVMKSMGGISIENIQQMQGMTDEQRAAYMQSVDPTGEAARRLAASEAKSAKEKERGAALMNLANYDRNIMDGLKAGGKMKDDARAKGLDIYERKYRARVRELENGMKQAIQDGAFEELPVPGTEARCAAAAERFRQLNYQKFEVLCKFYEEYIPVWRNAISGAMEHYKTKVMDQSRNREAFRSKMFAQTRSTEYAAPAFTPDAIAMEYFEISRDVVDYQLELPSDME